MSSGFSSSDGVNGEITGIPKVCGCGCRVSLKVSKSEGNPHRRYYRCDFAYERKLSNDNLLFKWMDVALAEEASLMCERVVDIRKDFGDLLMLMKDIDYKIEECVMAAKKECKIVKMMMVFLLCVSLLVFCASLPPILD